MAIASNLFRAGVLLLVLAAQAQAQTDPTVPLEQCSVNTGTSHESEPGSRRGERQEMESGATMAHRLACFCGNDLIAKSIQFQSWVCFLKNIPKEEEEEEKKLGPKLCTHSFLHLIALESTLADPPVSVPGFDAVEEQVAVFMMGQSDNEGENGGTLNIYMNNSITVGGFQWILRCKGRWQKATQR